MPFNNKQDIKIVVAGDSISKGVIYDETKSKYTILEENYVELVRDKLNGIIHNTSRFGSTIIKGIHKLKNNIFNEKPDIVLIEYGGNDCDFNWAEIAKHPEKNHQPRTDFETFESTLLETIDLVKKNKSTPILMNLPPLNADNYFDWVSKNNPDTKNSILKWLGSVTKIYWWQERYNSVILKIADQTKTPCIDVRSAFLQYPDYTKLLCIDGIHPNKEGHLVIANKTVDFVKDRYSPLLNSSILHR